jgi:hypothetical protein
MRVLLLAGAALVAIAATAAANEPVITLEGAATAAHWTPAQRGALAPQFATLRAELDALVAKESASHGAISRRLTAFHESMRAMHGGASMHGAQARSADGTVHAPDSPALDAFMGELAGDKDLAETMSTIHGMIEQMEPAQRHEFCAYLHARIMAAGLLTAGASGER